MLYREIIAVCSQIHTKHINTLWAGQYVEFVNVKLAIHVVTSRLQRVNMNYICVPSPYRAVNTLRLCYTNQSVNAV